MGPRRRDRETEQRKGRAGLGAGRRVLIAQSDGVLGEMYRDELEMDGWKVEVCADGTSAWEKLVDLCPDMLLVNTLPDIPTLAFLERLRGHGPTRDLAVVVLVDSLDNLDVGRARDLEVLAWLTKNRIMRERLSETLADLLADKNRSRPERDEAAPAGDQGPPGT